MKDKEINKMIKDMNASSKQEIKRQKQQEKEERLKWLQGTSIVVRPDGSSVASYDERNKINKKSKTIKMIGYIFFYIFALALIAFFSFTIYNSSIKLVEIVKNSIEASQLNINTAYDFIVKAFKILFMILPFAICVISIILFSINFFYTEPISEFGVINEKKLALTIALSLIPIIYFVVSMICVNAGALADIYYNIHGVFNEYVFEILKENSSVMTSGLICFMLTHAYMVVLSLLSHKYYAYVKKEKIKCTTFDNFFN